MSFDKTNTPSPSAQAPHSGAPRPGRADETLRLPTRPISCTACAKELVHLLQPQEGGCAWTCTVCGGESVRYTHDDMRAMVEAYAGPLARAANLPEMPAFAPGELEFLEVDVAPKSGGDTVTYTGVAVSRHVNACHMRPAAGQTFWGHHPKLAPHVAKFELGKIIAVRSASAETTVVP